MPVRVRLLPAPPDTGYVFRRTDLGGFEIPATVESVAHCGYATTLMRTGVMLSTVEHLLSALRGLGVDNVYIEVDNLEIPILDGSAEVFAEMIEQAGIVEQPLARRALLVREKVSFEQGNRRISVEPGDSYQIDCLIDFPHPMIGVQRFSLELNDGAFSREIAAARTFGFTEEIEELQRANLIRGGSLDNAIVLTPDGNVESNRAEISRRVCASQDPGHHRRSGVAGYADSGQGQSRTKRSHHACRIDVETAARAFGVGHRRHAGARKHGAGNHVVVECL